MHGILNLNKPAGLSSQQAVTKVKRVLKATKAGHAGTLDPFATGVLLVCINEATKVSRFLLEMNKSYRARVRLGQRTDTLDREGRIIEEKDISHVSTERLEEAVARFSGRILQTPPMYSALKVHGKPLYALARKGIEIERSAREVEVHDIRVLDFFPPFFDLFVSCSKGTYVRTLCDDIGAELGCGAHVSELERLSTDGFRVEHAVTLEKLATGRSLEEQRYFHSLDSALSGLREIVLDAPRSVRAKHGNPVDLTDGLFSGVEGEYVRIKNSNGELFGVGIIGKGILKIERILHL